MRRHVVVVLPPREDHPLMAGAHPIPSGPRLLLTTLRDTTWTPVREGEKRARQATRVVRGLIGEADMDRFTSMLHHIIHRCGDRPDAGKEVLCRPCYFCDFDHYELYERKLTGVTYIRLPGGPEPHPAFDIAMRELVTAGRVVCVRSPEGTGYRSCAPPDMGAFSEEETAVIDGVIARCSDVDAEGIDAASRRDAPWIVADDGGPLDREAVFYRDDDMSVRDYGEERRPIRSGPSDLAGLPGRTAAARWRAHGCFEATVWQRLYPRAESGDSADRWPSLDMAAAS